MCRETVPENGGGNWKGPPADSIEVVRWYYQLFGCGWSESRSRWHVSDAGEVGRQVHWRTTRRSWSTM